jgi:uncharacterized protein (TIGR00297 family)
VSLILDTIYSVPAADWYLSLIAITIISILLFLVEIGLKYFNLPSLYTRKFIHIITGIIVCVVAFYLYSNLPILLFASFYLIIDLWALKRGKFKSIHPDSRSYGTFFYAISVFVLALIFWDENKPLFIITNLIMIIPDAMAALMGEHYAKKYFVPISEKKSLPGAITMFILSFFIVYTSLHYFYDNLHSVNFLTAFIVGAIATVSELLSSKGSDNLSVPLLSGLYLHTLLFPTNSDMLMMVFIGLILAAVVAIISYKLRFLDFGGAATAFLMGSIIFGFGGWSYTFPILGFFILSSILSKIGKSTKKQYESSFQKTGIRDFKQAIANGGVATIITLIAYFSGIGSIYYVYIASLAAATADTWGTELGIFSRTKPVLITNLKKVEPGTSGGISLTGSLAGLVGSTLIVIIGSLFQHFTLYQFLFVVLAGFSGSLIDSILGATIQSQFRCTVCNKITERKTHCNSNTILWRGKIWVDNDLVNIFSISFSIIITLGFVFRF